MRNDPDVIAEQEAQIRTDIDLMLQTWSPTDVEQLKRLGRYEIVVGGSHKDMGNFAFVRFVTQLRHSTLVREVEDVVSAIRQVVDLSDAEMSSIIKSTVEAGVLSLIESKPARYRINHSAIPAFEALVGLKRKS